MSIEQATVAAMPDECSSFSLTLTNYLLTVEDYY